MNRLFKKTLSLVLVIVMTVSLGVSAAAADQTGAAQAEGPLGIVSAMSVELNALVEATKISKTEEIAGNTFYEGVLNGVDVVLVKAGIGKVLAASCAETLIDTYHVGGIVFTGIAGSHIMGINSHGVIAVKGGEVGPRDVEHVLEAAKAIAAMGAKAVLVKGGHRIADATDILFDGHDFHYYKGKRLESTSTHGTGCSLSSAIASNLANGLSLPDAVGAAKEYVFEGIAHAEPIGKGHGPIHHLYELYKKAGWTK